MHSAVKGSEGEKKKFVCELRCQSPKGQPDVLSHTVKSFVSVVKKIVWMVSLSVVPGKN